MRTGPLPLSRAIPALGLALTCAPALAAAEPWDCRFTVSCRAAAGCAESALSLRVIAADHAGDLFLSSALGDIPAARLTRRGGPPVSYAGLAPDGTADVLTITPDRIALMTRHIPGPADDLTGNMGTTAAITYFGTCEGLT